MPARRPSYCALVVLILAAFKDLASSATPSPASVAGPNSTSLLRPRGPGDIPPDDYYEDLYGTATTSPPSVVARASPEPRPCDYNVCLDGQPPCAELAALSDCLCPGVSLDRVAPEAPTLDGVSKQGTEVVVRWCAPYSEVVYYKVTVDGEVLADVSQDRRIVEVGQIASGVEVCVVAVNDAGSSTPGEGSCLIYEDSGDNSLALKAGLISGVLGFLLLLVLALLIWRHRAQRKAGVRISTKHSECPLKTL